MTWYFYAYRYPWPRIEVWIEAETGRIAVIHRLWEVRNA